MVRRVASSGIFERLRVVCKNVSGLLVERAPGHDEDSRAPVLIRDSVIQWLTTFYSRLGRRRIATLQPGASPPAVRRGLAGFGSLSTTLAEPPGKGHCRADYCIWQERANAGCLLTSRGLDGADKPPGNGKGGGTGFPFRSGETIGPWAGPDDCPPSRATGRSCGPG